MAASVVEMFRGRNVTVVEDMLAQHSGAKRTRIPEGLQLTPLPFRDAFLLTYGAKGIGKKSQRC